MLTLILLFLLGLAVGYAGSRWWSRRPRKVGQQDRDAGLRAYQKMKNGR